MLYKIFIAFLVSGVLVFTMWAIRGVLLTPISVGENERIRIVLTVCGESPCLQSTVESLLWFRENGTLACEIVIEDNGMDSDTRRVAEIMHRNGIITLTD